MFVFKQRQADLVEVVLAPCAAAGAGWFEGRDDHTEQEDDDCQEKKRGNWPLLFVHDQCRGSHHDENANPHYAKHRQGRPEHHEEQQERLQGELHGRPRSPGGC